MEARARELMVLDLAILDNAVNVFSLYDCTLVHGVTNIPLI